MELIFKNPKIIIISGKAKTGKNTVADMIKDMCNENNKKVINLAYASYLKEYAKNILNWDGNEETKPRKFLQELGVDLLKAKIDTKMLVNRIVQDIKVYSYFYDVITISDARFIDEIEIIKSTFDNAIALHLYRNVELKEGNHITETALDSYNNYDYTIDNSYDLESLYDKIKEIVVKEDICTR